MWNMEDWYLNIYWAFAQEKKELEWVEGFLGRRQVKLERGFRRGGQNASSPPDRGAQLLEAACQAGCEGVLWHRIQPDCGYASQVVHWSLLICSFSNFLSTIRFPCMREDDLCDLLRFDKKVLRWPTHDVSQRTLFSCQVKAGDLEDRQVLAS